MARVRVLRVQPERPLKLALGGLPVLGLALVQEKKYDEAIAELQRAVELSGGGAGQLGSLGYANAIAGRRAEALDVVEKLKKSSSEHYVPAATVAIVYSGLGGRTRR